MRYQSSKDWMKWDTNHPRIEWNEIPMIPGLNEIRYQSSKDWMKWDTIDTNDPRIEWNEIPIMQGLYEMIYQSSKDWTKWNTNDPKIPRIDTLFGRQFCQTVVLPPFWKGIYSKRKEFAPLWNKLFSFRVNPFSEGDNNGMQASEQNVTKVISVVQNGRKFTKCDQSL